MQGPLLTIKREKGSPPSPCPLQEVRGNGISNVPCVTVSWVFQLLSVHSHHLFYSVLLTHLPALSIPWIPRFGQREIGIPVLVSQGQRGFPEGNWQMLHGNGGASLMGRARQMESRRVSGWGDSLPQNDQWQAELPVEEAKSCVRCQDCWKERAPKSQDSEARRKAPPKKVIRWQGLGGSGPFH